MDNTKFREIVESLGGSYQFAKVGSKGGTTRSKQQNIMWKKRPHGPRCSQYNHDCDRPKTHALRQDFIQNKCSYCSRSDPPTIWDHKRLQGKNEPR